MELKTLLNTIVDAQTDVTYFTEQNAPGLSLMARRARDEALAALAKRVEALEEAAQRVVTNANIGARRSVYLVSHEDLMALQAALATLRE